jgi:hypothetical protein
MRIQRKLAVSLAAVSTLLVTSCSASGNSAGLTELQCGVLTEAQFSLFGLTSQFESVLMEDIETRQRAIWDAGYSNIAEYTSAMSEHSAQIGMIADMEETSPETSSSLKQIEDAISTYNYHWADIGGNELANSAVAVRQGQYKLLELCENYLDNSVDSGISQPGIDTDLPEIAPEYTYVAPLPVSAGCWQTDSPDGLHSSLQEQVDGKWITIATRTQLVEISYCDDVSYPFGVEFSIDRSSYDLETRSVRVLWKPSDGYDWGGNYTNFATCPQTFGNDTTEALSFGSEDCEN